MGGGFFFTPRERVLLKHICFFSPKIGCYAQKRNPWECIFIDILFRSVSSNALLWVTLHWWWQTWTFVNHKIEKLPLVCLRIWRRLQNLFGTILLVFWSFIFWTFPVIFWNFQILKFSLSCDSFSKQPWKEGNHRSTKMSKNVFCLYISRAYCIKSILNMGIVRRCSLWFLLTHVHLSVQCSTPSLCW